MSTLRDCWTKMKTQRTNIHASPTMRPGISSAVLHALVCFALCSFAQLGFAHSPRISEWVKLPDSPNNDYVKTIDDLINDRLELERAKFTKPVQPELVRLEANYIRTNSSTGDVVLYETSFHLEPHYYNFTAQGLDSTSRHSSGASPQPVMYFVGYARTPLALPIVSNLSAVLKGDQASYVVNLGVLPLPHESGEQRDSIRYYVVIERTIESNHSTNEVKIERFAKEFTAKANDPVQLRLENAPPEKQAYIVKMEDGSILHFYDDFARFFREHILLNSERLQYNLGKADISVVTSKLSIPYTVGQASHVKVELLSVLDTTSSRAIIDTFMRPADYIAELDMKPFANGQYRYRMTALDMATNNVLYASTQRLEKKSPLIVENGTPFTADTLEVGGRRENPEELLKKLNLAYTAERIKTERLEGTMNALNRDKKTLEDIVNAQKHNTIAGVRMRTGIGFGYSSGTNAFIGIESSQPAFALDFSFGLLYSSAPYLDYVPAKNISKAFDSPKSLGLQLSWLPARLFDGLLEPAFAVGYYGIWSPTASPGAQRSATLLVPALGIATEPFGEGRALGAALMLGETIPLGISRSAELDISAKFYVRF